MIDDAASVSTICKSWQRPRQLQYAKEYFMNTSANLTVRDLMQLGVHAVHPQMTLEELERQFIDKSVSGFPVVENENLVGDVSRSDIVRQLAVQRNLADPSRPTQFRARAR